jgi:nitroreductase
MKFEDLLYIIKNRRSIRSYEKKDVENEKIDIMLEAGQWSPSAGNLQSIEYIVVKGQNIKKELYKACLYQNHVLEAPVDIVVCCNMNKIKHYGERGYSLYTLQESGAAIQNMLLTAFSLGLGTCWVGAFDEDYVKNILKIPDHVRPVAIITVGYPKEKGYSSRRKLKDIVFYEGYRH